MKSPSRARTSRVAAACASAAFAVDAWSSMSGRGEQSGTIWHHWFTFRCRTSTSSGAVRVATGRLPASMRIGS